MYLEMMFSSCSASSICSWFCVSNKLLCLQVEADSGVIEKIQLTDFMCHRKLDVNLSSNVNFILGRNGSEHSL